MSLEKKILEHWGNADANTMRTGLTWYEKAYNEAILLSQVFDVSLEKVVGVISALSPRNKWARNLSDTWDLLDAPSMSTKVSTFNGQKEKALKILESDGKPETILGILNGEKTVNFFINILFYKHSEEVTVDVWAYRSVGLEPKQSNYSAVESAYKNVAEQLNLRPHQVQAVVWGVVRGKLA